MNPDTELPNINPNPTVKKARLEMVQSTTFFMATTAACAGRAMPIS